jgi:2-phospho-L-lactate/phosphoenolpyruvate guanylyltransferase
MATPDDDGSERARRQSDGYATVVVPIKAFDLAKGRLASVLDPVSRRRLARDMAEHVLTRAAPAPLLVVCDDDEVAAFATSLGARVCEDPGGGLNAAVRHAASVLADEGVSHIGVVHADLPVARPYARWLCQPGVTIVSDRRGDGTNLLVAPSVGFEFAYGPGSFARHAAHARARGMRLRIVVEPSLALDIDTPADLARIAATDIGSHTSRYRLGR